MIQPQTSFLDRTQCEQIHRAALEILRRTGVRVFHEGALGLLSEADCNVREENLVHIPPALVEWALQQPPPSFWDSQENNCEPPWHWPLRRPEVFNRTLEP